MNPSSSKQKINYEAEQMDKPSMLPHQIPAPLPNQEHPSSPVKSKGKEPQPKSPEFHKEAPQVLPSQNPLPDNVEKAEGKIVASVTLSLPGTTESLSIFTQTVEIDEKALENLKSLSPLPGKDKNSQTEIILNEGQNTEALQSNVAEAVSELANAVLTPHRPVVPQTIKGAHTQKLDARKEKSARKSENVESKAFEESKIDEPPNVGSKSREKVQKSPRMDKSRKKETPAGDLGAEEKQS